MKAKSCSKDDLKEYLRARYVSENITESEIAQIIRKLETYPASDLYDTNKSIMKLVSDGFIFKREDTKAKDIIDDLEAGLESFREIAGIINE